MKVTVIGAAGSVGAPAAFYIGASGLVDELVLIDMRPNVVQQHAMDMSTAMCDLGVRVKAGAHEDLAGSDVVINAAGVPQGLIADRMEMLPKNIPLVRDVALAIKAYCPDAFVITATNPIDPLNYCTWRAGGFDRRQVIGYSRNDSTRFREIIARLKGVKTARVQATVIGEHGSTQVPLFSSVAHRRRARVVHRVREDERPRRDPLDPQALRGASVRPHGGLDERHRAGGHHPGGRSRIPARSSPARWCWTANTARAGLSLSVPVKLGRGGVQEIQEWELAPDEQEGFERTAAAMAAAARIVDDVLG